MEPLNAILGTLQNEFSDVRENLFCSGPFGKLWQNWEVMKTDRIFLTEENLVSRKSAQSTVTSLIVCCTVCPCLLFVRALCRGCASVGSSSWKIPSTFFGSGFK